jgi:hypothetical protein
MSKVPGKRSQQQNDSLAPLAPTNVVATNVGTNRAFNNGAASVSFSLPAGSPAADSFTVSATASGQTTRTATGSSSPIVVQNLTSTITYTIRVTAANAAGTSPVSSSVTVVATTVPATPAAPTVQNFANDQKDYLSWAAPANGGSALISYFYESTDAKSGSGSAGTTAFTVDQEGATSQQYRIRVTNANGTSEWSPYSNPNTTPPFFPPFFPFFPPFFPFFPFFPPSFPFFPFFPPRFPFFPFFPPRFPFFPFFPPRFPFFPFFPPRFPFFKPRRCLAANTNILTPEGWSAAKSLKVGDKVISISKENIDLLGLIENKKAATISGQVNLIETEIVSIETKTSVLVEFNGLGKNYSVTQPVLVETTDNNLTYIEAGDIQVGSTLLGVSEAGIISKTTVISIEKDDFESEVYDIRTSPVPWFITDSFIVIA